MQKEFKALGSNTEYTIHLKKEMTTHSVFLPGEFHGQRSLEVLSPWGHEESDMIEAT